VPQQAVLGQLREGDLCHELGPHPGDAARVGAAQRFFERRRLTVNGLKRVCSSFKRGFVKPVRPCRVQQLAFLRVPSKERAEMTAAPEGSVKR